jgi:hypothetical protein
MNAMPITHAVCPECGAGLKCSDPAGFEVGEKIDCPKCQTRFAVRAPARPREEEEDRPPKKKAVKAAEVDDEDDDRPRKRKRPRDVDEEEEEDRPRKKKKRRRDDDERSGYQKYRTSPVRFIILGVLVLVMLVLAFFLYQKWQREKETGALPLAASPSRSLS